MSVIVLLKIFISISKEGPIFGFVFFFSEFFSTVAGKNAFKGQEISLSSDKPTGGSDSVVKKSRCGKKENEGE